MRKIIPAFLAGVLCGVLLLFAWMRFVPGTTAVRARIQPKQPSVCYSCFWQGYPAELHQDLLKFFRQYKTDDPFVRGDVAYIIWRATSVPNCDARQQYRRAASSGDLFRSTNALAVLGFSGPECGEDSLPDLRLAADTAEKAGLGGQAKVLLAAANGALPEFGSITRDASLTVPAGAKTMILGETKLEIAKGMKVGTQVDRVTRDWISYQLRWDLTGTPVPQEAILNYHEGAVAKTMAMSGVEIVPLAGTAVARKENKWYAPDENGVLRFHVLDDKLLYPTSHVTGDFGWLTDTHGISALVAQAIGRKVQVVLGCGDSDGKMDAAFYLAQKGIHVIFPGDRYEDALLGYKGDGVLIGGAPVKDVAGKVVVGEQPIRFLLDENIVVEDTKEPFPIQYYDAGARYFRKLSASVPLKITYVEVNGASEISKVLTKAREMKAQVAAVRVANETEDLALREWLKESPKNRAILFHSGLYRYAQPLFRDFRAQVTFGDLRPRFE